MLNEIVNKLDKLKKICKKNFSEDKNFYKIECGLEEIIVELELWENRDAKDLDFE